MTVNHQGRTARLCSRYDALIFVFSWVFFVVVGFFINDFKVCEEKSLPDTSTILQGTVTGRGKAENFTNFF